MARKKKQKTQQHRKKQRERERERKKAAKNACNRQKKDPTDRQTIRVQCTAAPKHNGVKLVVFFLFSHFLARTQPHFHQQLFPADFPVLLTFVNYICQKQTRGSPEYWQSYTPHVGHKIRPSSKTIYRTTLPK